MKEKYKLKLLNNSVMHMLLIILMKLPQKLEPMHKMYLFKQQKNYIYFIWNIKIEHLELVRLILFLINKI